MGRGAPPARGDHPLYGLMRRRGAQLRTAVFLRYWELGKLERFQSVVHPEYHFRSGLLRSESPHFSAPLPCLGVAADRTLGNQSGNLGTILLRVLVHIPDCWSYPVTLRQGYGRWVTWLKQGVIPKRVAMVHPESACSPDA
jgi:hypothetical protein